MLLRVLTTLAGAPLLLALAWAGGLYLAAAVAALVLLTQHEVVRLLRELNPHRGLVFAGGLVISGNAFFWPAHFPGGALLVLLLLYLVSLVAAFPRFSPASCAGTILSAFYPGLLAYVYLLRTLPDGWQWLLLVLLTTWAFDTFAYFTGKLLGRVLITPRLSPKKTLEGLAGGLLAALALTGGAAVVFGAATAWPFILLGVLIGSAAQAGDLLASAFKRFAGVKDAGRLLPGHGGVLDRFDSLLLTAPIAYYYVNWLI